MKRFVVHFSLELLHESRVHHDSRFGIPGYNEKPTVVIYHLINLIDFQWSTYSEIV